MATVLTAMLAGASVMAGSYVVVQYVQANQDQSVSVHSLTQAQMNAWTGAEMLRQFLESTPTVVASLPSSNSPATSVVLSGAQRPTDIDIALKKAPNGSDVQAVIKGTGGGTSLKSKTSATLSLYYEITAKEPPGKPDDEIHIKPIAAGHGMNILLKGDVTWKADNSADASIFSSGDIMGDAHSFKGWKSNGDRRPLDLTSLGTINVGADTAYGTVTANCDVSFSAFGSADTVKAGRNLCTKGASKITGTATANNRITASGSGWVNGTFQARVAGDPVGPICKPPGTPQNASLNIAATCDPETVNGVSLSGGATFGAVKSLGNIKISNATVSGSVQAFGSIDSDRPVNRLAGTPTIDAIPVLNDTNEAPFNAWQYIGSANYIFYFDKNGTPKVRIRNVNGLIDDVYNVTGNPLFSNLTSNLTVDATKGLWTVRQNGFSTANFVSGVVWFQGDLNIEQGTYYNTFIATGNIKTGGGDDVIFPPNFATQNARINTTGPGGGPYYPTYFDLVRLCDRIKSPKNYCKTNGDPVGNYNLQASGVGSYALMAGSFYEGSIGSDGNVTSIGRFKFGETKDYVGGNIYPSIKVPVPNSVDSSGNAFIWGYILAGNGTDTTGGPTGQGGSAFIYGRINSQGYGSKNPGQTLTYMGLGGSTVIDLTKVPASVSTTRLGDGGVGSLGSTEPVVAPLNAAPAVALAVGNAGRGTMGTANSVSVVAGVAGAPQFLSAATLQASAGTGAPANSGPVAVTIVNATFN